MKKVWLIHESGKKYGPYDAEGGITSDSVLTPASIMVKPILAQEWIAPLGFRIEEELPEKITVTREMLIDAIDEWKDHSPRSYEQLWRALCEESKKGEVK